MNSKYSANLIYRELLELCDFLLLSSSPEDEKEAGKAVLNRLATARESLGLQITSRIQDAMHVLETYAGKAAQSNTREGGDLEPRKNIIKAREVIERELNCFEQSKQYTFDDTLQQIESLCVMIRNNGPIQESEGHFMNATTMLALIAAYRMDPSPARAGEIMVLLDQMESSTNRIQVPQKRTNRPLSQFKKIWSTLMRDGVDVMHPHKAWVAICEYLREKGEPEEKLPTREKIESLYRDWTK